MMGAPTGPTGPVGPLGQSGPPVKGGGSTGLIVGIIVLVLLLISAGVAFALTRSKSDVVGAPPASTTTVAGASSTTAKGSTDSTEPDETTTTRKTPRTTKPSVTTPDTPDTTTSETIPADPSVPETFPVPADTPAAIAAAGLPELPSEGDIVHYHAHVDLRISGQDVTVAAQIGIGSSTISPVHTHDTTGVVHIESFEDDEFTVGQFFTEWGLDLTAECVETYCADATHELRVAVNGVELPPGENPADIVFDTHDEIAIWYGPTNTDVSFPPDYEFEGGL